MSTTDTLAGSGPGVSKAMAPAGSLAAAIAAAFWRHRAMHAVATATLLLGVAVGAATGNHPDFGVLQEYSYLLGVALWAVACGLAVIRLVMLALIERNPAPLSAFLASFARFFGDRDRLINGCNGLVAFLVFASGFSVLKGAIAILQPFSWDAALLSLDRFLHGGRLPHEWLWWVLDRPNLVIAINFAYNCWFVILLAMVFGLAFARRDTALRHQFFLTFMLVWVVGGFLVAVGFSSAGPCYLERLGLGDAYRPLMDALHRANQTWPIWALPTQDTLWKGYVGATSGSVGISAFPSLHVATATLFALYASRRSALAGVAMWCFAAIIMLGSVVLGWHYAVDGYAGALICLLIWKAVGRYLHNFRADAAAPGPGSAAEIQARA